MTIEPNSADHGEEIPAPVAPDVYSSDAAIQTIEPEPAPPAEPAFDLANAPIPSFASLQEARAAVFRQFRSIDSFRNSVERMSEEGETGRRKGLGLWMLGKLEAAANQLAVCEDDDVAAFTRANALMSLGRPAEAEPIFQRLSDKYPQEPRPRGGRIEARLESELLSGDAEVACKNLEEELRSAPEGFDTSAEGRYLQGRADELNRLWESALEHYETARAADPTHRPTMFHLAHLAERCGLDEEALDAYETLVQLLPIDKAVLFNLGVLYEDFGRDADAAACYDTIVRSDPTDRRARLYLQDARSAMDMYYDEDLERKEDRLNQILRTPITDFELSVRARNCLNKMDIVTLGDLVRQTEQELLSYKNFGETSLNEIKEILTSKNLRLGMAHEEAVASIEAASRPRATGENAELLNKPVADLDLSIRARRTVENLGCLTVGDIVQHSEDEMLQMPNFGVTSLQELKRKMTEFGVKFADKK
jgi:DNA-directed RNA polymerase subunit alpha